MEHRNFIRFVGLLLLLCVVATAFHGSQTRIEDAINQAFKEAIEQDYQNRKAYLTRNSSNRIRDNVKDYVLAPSVGRKLNSYSIRTRTGITTYQFRDSINEETAKQLLNQYLLDQSHPIHPAYLKAAFQKRLKKKDLTGKVGVLCIRPQGQQWSAADSIVPPHAYSTPRQVLDITGQIKAQAWVDYDWKMLFRYLDPVVYLLIVLIIGVFMWVRASRRQPEEAEEDGSSDIHIDMERQELTIDGVPCTIAKLDLTLLQMIYERNGECLTRDEIKQQFWPTDDNAGEKIDTHIKTIRKLLKDFPNYQVITVRGKGYYWQANAMSKTTE